MGLGYTTSDGIYEFMLAPELIGLHSQLHPTLFCILISHVNKRILHMANWEVCDMMG